MLARSLTLTGFIGIRDGLGRDSVTIDFARERAGTALVALTGGNGRGKTTILDNMPPYLVMASKAGGDGLGAFSYYDEVYLPVSEKVLDWEMDGTAYRQHLVIRINGRRRTEAYLHQRTDCGWVPVRLPDGTVSDGRTETYNRCVEHIAGPAATFFATAFSAQNRRQLSAYRHAEIKNLLADLLGLERVRALAERASDTGRLLRAGLCAAHEQRASLQAELDQLTQALEHMGDAASQADLARHNRNIALARLDARKADVASLRAQSALAAEHDARRSQLQLEREHVLAQGRAALAQITQQAQREQMRLNLLAQRSAQRLAAWETDLAALRAQRTELQRVVHEGRHVDRAVCREPLLHKIHARRSADVEGWRHQARQYELLQSRMTLVRAELANVEREAGMAVLKAQELRQRLALTAQVPCAGSELQQRCRLLANAHAAQPLLPSANATIQRLNAAHQQLHADLAALAAQVGMHASAPQTLQRTLDRCKRTQARLSATQLLVARKPDILRARANLGYLDARIGALKAEGPGAQTEEAAEREAIQAQLDTIATQEQEARRQACDGLARIDTLMAALPPPFDGTVLACASRALAQAQNTAEDAEQAYLRALHVQHQRDELSRRCEDNAHKEVALAKRIAYIEARLAVWSLFAKSLGNEGIVALAIDDAGPELSALTNDLLNACYGPRFTVSITTQLETAKGEAREGFAITVHDAVRGTAKNVAKMSGGERIWINECLTRAMALYLAHGSGRRSQTLFSDEADGAFDEQHKRQFMAMKREVLRIGGYAQEYFISHTPELAAMADAIIDLDQYCARPESVEGQASMNQGS